MSRMRRDGRRRDGGRVTGGLPAPLRRLAGGIALVATVRAVDVLWRRLAGRPTPVAVRSDDGDTRAADPAVVRDRLAYALLLGGALRLARRLGLPDDERT
jgi:hypothetical protein